MRLLGVRRSETGLKILPMRARIRSHQAAECGTQANTRTEQENVMGKAFLRNNAIINEAHSLQLSFVKHELEMLTCTVPAHWPQSLNKPLKSTPFMNHVCQENAKVSFTKRGGLHAKLSYL